MEKQADFLWKNSINQVKVMAVGPALTSVIPTMEEDLRPVRAREIPKMH